MASGSGSVFAGARLRSGSDKLTTVVDAEGREVQAESRSDEEQKEKLQQIIELLLAAGYFRARIKGLSPFDKIVGGMTWCITTCNFDVDVDLLFQENATIGQKIALTEKIVATLPRMKCPHRIEPHQIQGLDSINIFPVMQWLVRRAIETREDMGDYIRSFAVSQFNRDFKTPQDAALEEKLLKTSETFKTVKHAYRAQRRLRRPDLLRIKDEQTRVRSTLLEYGRKIGYSSTSEKSGGTAEETSVGAEAKEKEQKEREKEERRIKKLLSGMAQTGTQEGKLAASAVGNILQSTEIQEAAATYAEKHALLEQEVQQSEGAGGVQHHQRTVAALHKQIKLLEAELSQTVEAQQQAEQEQTQSQSLVQQAEQKSSEVQRTLAELTEREAGANQGVLRQLRDLVSVNEALRKQEQQFKSHCKEELQRLKSETSRLESLLDVDSDEKQRLATVEKQFTSDKEKLNKIRSLMGRKIREIATLQRRLDEVPSRAELAQYQRRFLELYEQVAATHRETKQFYALYNTLDDTKLYLGKEVSLLNSIYDTFTQAMSSQSGREQFLRQLENIVDGVAQKKAKVETRQQQCQMKKDQLGEEHRQLLDTQRTYFKMLKDFREECRKSQILEAKLEERR